MAKMRVVQVARAGGPLELDDVERRYPADHYVLIDDKRRILNAVKSIWVSA